MNNQRNSSIELLKIIGMVMIVVFHCYMTVTTTRNSFFPVLEAGIDFAQLPKGPTKLILLVVGYFGPIGNLIFIICAAWFLYDSNIVRVDKMIMLALSALLISILNLVVICFLFPNVTFSAKYIHDSFFPIFYTHNWFITCYLMLYSIHGALNRIIRSWSRKTHLLVAGCMFFMYSIVTLYARPNHYFSSNFIVSVMLYVLTTYIKTYMNNSYNGKHLILAGLIGLVWLVISKQIGFPASIRDQGLLLWAENSNPFLILLVAGIIILAARRCYHNDFVNDFSAVSLELYLIHENLTFRSVVRPIIWNDLSDKIGGLLLTRFILFSTVILAYGLGASVIFSTLVKPHIRLLAKWLAQKLIVGWEMMTNKLLI